MNKYKPAEYPTFKDEKRLETSTSKSNTGFILPKAAIKKNLEETKTNTQEETNARTNEERSVEVGKRKAKQPKNNTNSSKQAKPDSGIEAIEALDEATTDEKPTNPESATPINTQQDTTDDDQIEAIEEIE